MTLRPVSPRKPDEERGEFDGKILYVEDHDSNWRVTRHGLAPVYDVVRARDSEEALALLATLDIRLVLLDVELKGSELDGIELARAIRGRSGERAGVPAARRTVPIVFVTAFEERYRRDDLLAEGADEVVYKPVDLTRLRLVIARLTLKTFTDS